MAFQLLRNQLLLFVSCLFTISYIQAEGMNIAPGYSVGVAPLLLGLAGAVPLCLAGLRIARSPAPDFIDLNAATNLFALSLLGGRRNLPLAGAAAAALGLVVGTCEELSFRGLGLPVLAQRISDGGGSSGLLLGLLASSLTFGLAHWAFGGRLRENLITTGLQAR